jgi:hypothetical protein
MNGRGANRRRKSRTAIAGIPVTKLATRQRIGATQNNRKRAVLNVDTVGRFGSPVAENRRDPGRLRARADS